MGRQLEGKENIVIGVIIGTFILQYASRAIISIFFGISIFHDFEVHYKLVYYMGLPYTIVRLLMLYSLRKSLVFKILLYTSSIFFIVTSILFFSGYFESFDAFNAYILNMNIINIIVYSILIIIAAYKREASLTIAFLSMTIAPMVIHQLHIVEDIVNSSLFQNSEPINVLNVYSFINFIYYISLFVIFIIIFIRDGIKSNDNFEKKDLQFNIDN